MFGDFVLQISKKYLEGNEDVLLEEGEKVGKVGEAETYGLVTKGVPGLRIVEGDVFFEEGDKFVMTIHLVEAGVEARSIGWIYLTLLPKELPTSIAQELGKLLRAR